MRATKECTKIAQTSAVAAVSCTAPPKDPAFLEVPKCAMSGIGVAEKVRAARVQNETAPEKLLNRYKKRSEKHEKGSEKRSETRLKNV